MSQFLCEKLDGERGKQTQLAHELQISKSTITAWRNGAKPDFVSCLMLADYFNVPPDRLLAMVGDEAYGTIYRHFMASGSTAHSRRPLSERDLYPDPAHAQVHQDLQALLDTGSEEAQAIATMIRTAISQVSPHLVSRLPRRKPRPPELDPQQEEPSDYRE